MTTWELVSPNFDGPISDAEATWELDDGRVLDLLTPEQLDALPEGVELVSIIGRSVTTGLDAIDRDRRYGRLGYGIPR